MKAANADARWHVALSRVLAEPFLAYEEEFGLPAAEHVKTVLREYITIELPCIVNSEREQRKERSRTAVKRLKQRAGKN